MVEDLAFRYLAAGERVRRLGAERVSPPPRPGAERRLYAGAGVGAVAGHGASWAGWRSTRRGLRPTPVKIAWTQSRRCAIRGRDCAVRCAPGRRQADRDDQEPGGLDVAIGELNKALEEMPRRLERLKKSGLKKLSRTDEDARFMRQRGDKFVLGYSAEIAVSDDHLIVAQRVTQNVTDNDSLEPMMEQAEQRCGAPPERGPGRQRLLLHRQHRTAWNSATSMLMSPIRTWRGALNLGTRCRTRACAPAPSPHARQIAKSGRTGRLCAAQGGGRTGLRSPQTTTRYPPISHPGIEQRQKRIHPGHPGLQHHPAVRHAHSLKQNPPCERGKTQNRPPPQKGQRRSHADTLAPEESNFHIGGNRPDPSRAVILSEVRRGGRSRKDLRLSSHTFRIDGKQGINTLNFIHWLTKYLQRMIYGCFRARPDSWLFS